jgi:hypothetical protein
MSKDAEQRALWPITSAMTSFARGSALSIILGSQMRVRLYPDAQGRMRVRLAE